MNGYNKVTCAFTPVFDADGSVYNEYIQIYTSIQQFSGWALRRGDHKSPLPHSYSKLHVYGGGTLRRIEPRVGGWNYYLRVMCAYPDGVNTSFDQELYNSCIDKLNGKVRGDLDLSVDAFQSRQTARQFMAGDLVTNFANDVRDWDRRNKSASMKLERAINRAIPIARLAGALRLTWVYGWKPLIDDFYGILDESLRTYINKYQTYNSVSRSEYTYQCKGYVENGSNNYAPYTVSRKESCRVSVTLDTSQLPGMANWTSLNPASIAWELVPFSFVIDWFVNVGDTLRSIETALLYNRAFKTGFVSRIVVNKGLAQPHITDYGYYRMSYEGTSAFTSVNFDRTVLTSFPIRKLPSVDPGLSTPRLFNAISLLTQFLGGRKK